MILLVISFIAGLLTILAPCTIALLPVIIGSSVAGEETAGKKKAFVIAASLGVSVVLFTLLLKASTAFINIPEQVWQIVSGSIILVFGLISLFPAIWEKIPFVAKMNVSSNKLLATGYLKQSFWGDVIIGASLGPVFSTCSPTYFVILATVLPQSFFLGFIDLIAYAVGLSGMLLLVAFIGQKIVGRLEGLSDTHGWFKRTLGALFIALGIMIIFGLNKVIELKIASSGTFDITKLEQSLLRLNDTSKTGGGGDITLSTSTVGNNGSGTGTTSTTSVAIVAKAKSAGITLSHGPKAPEFVNPSGFINTDGLPITISQFKGKKVVLIDVWTYSCINCQRTLPYVVAWYKKYKDQGLEIIGLHTPEFAFEKIKSNVEDATRRFNIEYPVVMDNDYATWNAYGNQYWPRKYLINVNGEIVYDHIGEGDYDKTEKEIQKALLELKQVTGADTTVSTQITAPSNAISYDGTAVGSPETYFGATRNSYLANGQKGKLGSQTLPTPAIESVSKNALYLGGTWNFTNEYAENTDVGKIVYKYKAKNVYIVGSSAKGVNVTVILDGVRQKTINIKSNMLYTLVEGNDYSEHTLELDMDSAGLQAFTFTFG